MESVSQRDQFSAGGTAKRSMNLLSYLRSLGARFFHRARTEDELEAELSQHIQLRIKDLRRSGLAPTEAKRRARIEFGSNERFKAECREAMAGNFLDTLFQDLRFTVRILAKSPGFSAVHGPFALSCAAQRSHHLLCRRHTLHWHCLSGMLLPGPARNKSRSSDRTARFMSVSRTVVR